MADPVTLAVIGGMVGAATSDDPLKGALLGAVGGYGGGALFGAGAAGAGAAAGTAGASTAGQASLMAGTGALAPGLGASAGAGGTAFGSTIGLSAPSTAIAPSLLGGTEMAAGVGMNAGSSMLAPSVGTGAMGLGDKLMGYGGKAMSALNSNPVVAQMGMGMMQTAMQPRPPGPVLQGQIQRGQIAAPQFGGARMPQRRPMSLLG